MLEGGVPRTMKRALSHGYFSAFLSLAILCAPSLEITTDEIRILKHAGSADTSEATTAEAIACQSHFSSRLTAVGPTLLFEGLWKGKIRRKEIQSTQR